MAPPRMDLGPEGKVALLGSHGTMHYAPWHDPTWKLFAHAACRHYYRRTPDWYIDMHPYRYRLHPDTTERFQKYIKWLKRNTTPIYVWDDHRDIPAGIRYPREQILGEYQKRGENVFTNHAAWMIALLLGQGVKTIGIFGINYGAEEERQTQRESLVYWIAMARGKGVEVIIPRDGKHKSTVLCQPMELYGPESHNEKCQLLPSYHPPSMTIKTQGKLEKLTILKPGEEPSVVADLGGPPQRHRAPWNWPTEDGKWKRGFESPE